MNSPVPNQQPIESIPVENECDHNNLLCTQCVNTTDSNRSTNETNRFNGIINLINEASSKCEEIEKKLLENSEKEKEKKNRKHEDKKQTSKSNSTIYSRTVEEYLSGQKDKVVTAYEFYQGDLMKSLTEKLEQALLARTEKMKKLNDIGKFMLSDGDETKQLLLELKDCSSADIDFLLKLANTESLWQEMHTALNSTFKEKFEKIHDGLFGSERYIDSVLKYSNKNINKHKNVINKKFSSNQSDNTITETTNLKKKKSQNVGNGVIYRIIPDNDNRVNQRNKKANNEEITSVINRKDDYNSLENPKSKPPIGNYRTSKKTPKKPVYESDCISKSGSELSNFDSEPESELGSKDEEFRVEDERKYTRRKKIKNQIEIFNSL